MVISFAFGLSTALLLNRWGWSEFQVRIVVAIILMPVGVLFLSAVGRRR